MATERPSGLQFVKRVYLVRSLGFGLGCFVMVAALWPYEYSTLLWSALCLNFLVWPHLAYLISSRSSNLYACERRQLLIDAALGGFWIVAMGFNPIASSALAMMLSMNLIAAGGIHLFARGLLVSMLGHAAGLVLFGWRWHFVVSDALIFSLIPVLVLYPILIGSITYNISMQLHRQKELLKHLSRTDALTDIFNRGYWELRAREEIVRVRRSHVPLSLLLIDVDHFKSVNDTYGHHMGDHVLQQIAQYLQWNLRESELLGRYGGEEFGIILPDEDIVKAWQLGERLREFIEQAEFQDPADPTNTRLRCTISIGVAAFGDTAGDFSSWIRAADAALYEAKNLGRNRCIVYVPDNAPAIQESV